MARVAAPSLIAWVGRNILPHEGELRGWLRRTFPALDPDDVVQEAYCRIAGLADVEHIRNPRLYLFQTAKNIVLEHVRHSRVVSIEAASGLADFLEVEEHEAFSPERITADRRMLSRVEELISALPARGRQIFRMRKIDGTSQREIARIMGVTETVVENEVTRGLRAILSAMTDDERSSIPYRRNSRTDSRGQRSQD